MNIEISLQECQEAFERWVSIKRLLVKNDKGEYTNPEIRKDYRVWKASWKSAIENVERKENYGIRS